MPPDLARPLAGFGIAMIAVLWTNDAWYCVTWIAGEMKQPQRDLPRALLIGISLLTLIYVVVNLAYLYALPMPSCKGVSRVAERAATALVGANGATLRRADGRRLDVRLQRRGDPRRRRGCCSRWRATACSCRRRAQVHPRYRTPHVAIVALAAWSAVLALSGTYEQLFTYVMFASILLH